MSELTDMLDELIDVEITRERGEDLTREQQTQYRQEWAEKMIRVFKTARA